MNLTRRTWGDIHQKVDFLWNAQEDCLLLGRVTVGAERRSSRKLSCRLLPFSETRLPVYKILGNLFAIALVGPDTPSGSLDRDSCSYVLGRPVPPLPLRLQLARSK